MRKNKTGRDTKERNRDREKKVRGERNQREKETNDRMKPEREKRGSRRKETGEKKKPRRDNGLERKRFGMKQRFGNRVKEKLRRNRSGERMSGGERQGWRETVTMRNGDKGKQRGAEMETVRVRRIGRKKQVRERNHGSES